MQLEQVQGRQFPAGPDLGLGEQQQQQQQHAVQVPDRGQFNLSPAEYSRVGPPKGGIIEP
jgi:hypothetical protein